MTLFSRIFSLRGTGRRRDWLTGLAAAGAVLLATPATVAGTPDTLTPFQAEYKVRFKGLRGTMSLALEATPDGYRATSRLSPKGFGALFARGELVETSEFSIDDHGLRPTRYTKQDTVGKNDDRVTLLFDWAAGLASGTLNDTELSHDLDEQSVDRASLQYALMLDMMHGRSATTYTMLDSERRKTVVIEQGGERQIEVPLGRFTAQEVRHQSEGSSRRTVLYLADELGYLPVRIEQYKNDKLRVRADLARHSTPST